MQSYYFEPIHANVVDKFFVMQCLFGNRDFINAILVATAFKFG